MPKRKTPTCPTSQQANGDESDVDCCLQNLTPRNAFDKTRSSVTALTKDLCRRVEGETLVERCKRAVNKNDRPTYLALFLAVCLLAFAILYSLLRPPLRAPLYHRFR